MRPIDWRMACILLALVFPRDALSARLEAGLDDHQKIARLDSNTPRGNIEINESSSQEIRDAQARTFGHKRIQFMLMPMMYKMGVMMTMLTVLTVISLKGVLIGVILLILKLSTVIAKFYPSGHGSGWQPHHGSSWPGQPIHVHVHNSLPLPQDQAYNGWISGSGPGDEQHYYYKG